MEDRPIIFYDGTCYLCHGFVKFVLKNESSSNLMFSSLQSEFAKTVLPEDVIANLDTVVFYDPQSKSSLIKSKAVIAVLKHMGGVWRLNAWLLTLFPTVVADVVYSMIASNRYRWFGQSNVCMNLPNRDREID
ncbi:MAG: thiol-disulfide oxidoreductase DCC family protein [Candidatus Marinamargulisbacteria bacterium]